MNKYPIEKNPKQLCRHPPPSRKGIINPDPLSVNWHRDFLQGLPPGRVARRNWTVETADKHTSGRWSGSTSAAVVVLRAGDPWQRVMRVAFYLWSSSPKPIAQSNHEKHIRQIPTVGQSARHLIILLRTLRVIKDKDCLTFIETESTLVDARAEGQGVRRGNRESAFNGDRVSV